MQEIVTEPHSGSVLSRSALVDAHARARQTNDLFRIPQRVRLIFPESATNVFIKILHHMVGKEKVSEFVWHRATELHFYLEKKKHHRSQSCTFTPLFTHPVYFAAKTTNLSESEI